MFFCCASAAVRVFTGAREPPLGWPERRDRARFERQWRYEGRPGEAAAGGRGGNAPSRRQDNVSPIAAMKLERSMSREASAKKTFKNEVFLSLVSAWER